MLRPGIRRVLEWIFVPLVLLFCFLLAGVSAPAQAAPNPPSAGTADLTPADLVLVGIVGLAAASAAIAVRMVRRSH
jgi:hypothetical protein